MDNTYLYWLQAQTNLHVGSGDSNYGVIDNRVQREVLTNFPTINESGLKGALKEFCTHQIKVRNNDRDTKAAHRAIEIQQNFGNSDDTGNLRFYGANILTFPVRTNKVMFLHATCPQLLTDFSERLLIFGFEELSKKIQDFKAEITKVLKPNQPVVFTNSLKDLQIEYKNFKAVANDKIEIPKIFSKELVVVQDNDAKKIIGPNKLPIIARNSLIDGKSDNLWYEEIVPRQTKFYFFVQDNSIKDSQYMWFENQVHQKAIHVGANASIGQGLCKINNYKKDEE